MGKILKQILPALLQLLFLGTVFAQTFVEQTSIPVTGVSNSSTAWADFNLDGKPDFIICGSTSSGRVTKIYKNTGSNTFQELTGVTLPGVDHGSVAWFDFDNDGYPDILLTGEVSTNNGISRIFRNNGNETFTEVLNLNLTGVYNSSVAAGDYNHDLFTDILITGMSNSGTPVSLVYKNNGNGTFSQMSSIVLTGVYNSSVIWCDIENNGYPDIILTGNTGTSIVTKVYRNNLSGNFIISPISNLPTIESGSVSSADINMDGFPDIILSGSTGTSNVTKVYINNTNSTFTEITTTPFPGTSYGCTAWADYNLDSYPDLLLTGNTSTGRIAKIYRNNGNNTFTDMTGIVLTGVSNSCVAWCDYDGDNDPDILLTGSDGTNSISKIYRNEGSYPFTPLISGITNLTFGSVAFGDYDADGDLDILITGSVGLNRMTQLFKNMGYGFAEQNVSFANVNHSTSNFFDYNNDGYPDVILTGYNGTSFISKVYRNDGNSHFTEMTGIVLTGVADGAVATGDLNNDGLPDILLTGWTGNEPVSKIYFNNGDGTFTEQTGISLPGVYLGSVALADFNNDGYTDILITGSDVTSDISKIFMNDGNGGFNELTTASLTGVRYSSVACSDYNCDGYTDILLSGNNGTDNITKLYKNDGNGLFTEQTSLVLPGVNMGSVSWGDFDNDGLSDILVAGKTDSVCIAKIFRNNGDNTFTEQTACNLTGVTNCSAAWGDINNDGNLDILISGTTQNDNNSTRLYRNNALVHNTPPVVPVITGNIVTGTDVTLSWVDASDSQTPQAGLTYNISVGKSLIMGDEVSPMSDLNTGYRFIPAIGNAGHVNTYLLKNLAGGAYYWKVQAIDNSFAGGHFSTSADFFVFGVDSSSVTNVTCFGGNNGAIDISVVGGSVPYSYLWSVGATSQDISGLEAGSYSVTISDSGGNNIIYHYNVTQPPEIVLSYQVQFTSNAALSDGSVNLTITGGTAPYTVHWSNDEWTQNITGLHHGSYSVTVTDHNHCIVVGSVSVYVLGINENECPGKNIFYCFKNGQDKAEIVVDVESASFVVLTAYSCTGEKLLDIYSGYLPAGHHNFSMDTGNMQHAVYFVRMTANGKDQVKALNW